jgi:hypothetical protein
LVYIKKEGIIDTINTRLYTLAVALYDYEVADEGEISFKQGDLLGIISKGDDGDDQGWWEASLLDKQNQKVVRTGLVPSNFIETAFRA